MPCWCSWCNTETISIIRDVRSNFLEGKSRSSDNFQNLWPSPFSKYLEVECRPHTINTSLVKLISDADPQGMCLILVRCQSPKYENGFKHLWHLASGQAMNTNDENL